MGETLEIHLTKTRTQNVAVARCGGLALRNDCGCHNQLCQSAWAFCVRDAERSTSSLVSGSPLTSLRPHTWRFQAVLYSALPKRRLFPSHHAATLFRFRKGD